MLYLVIGLFVAVAAVGAFLRQQGRHSAPPSPPDAEKEAPEAAAPSASPTEGTGMAVLKDDSAPSNPTHAVKPISSPTAVVGATYAAAGRDSSPYGYRPQEKTERPEPKDGASLLRWCGKAGTVQVGDTVLLGPVIYWSNGPAAVDEPSCVDVTLPVEYPQEGAPLPAEGAVSYRAMTPLQRGIYLTWLAGGRIQPPVHLCYPSIWLYGIERRAIADRLDLELCLAEAFRMLPLMRWDAMRTNLIHFITWLAVKMWLPEDTLLSFCKRLNTVPDELFGVLLGSYAKSKLPLPSGIAFTLARTSAKVRGTEEGTIAHSDELMKQFGLQYKNACKGGLILAKPKSSLSLTYVPTNPTLARSEDVQKEGDKKGDPHKAVLEIPNFFEDMSVFEPLSAVWRDFSAKLGRKRPETAAEALEERPDFEGFLAGLRPQGSEGPLLSTLAALGELMKLDAGERPSGRDRKGMVDLARVEGYQILPNLGLSGREYHWEDAILFLPMEEPLDQEYDTASFLLEFLCSLTGAREMRLFEPLRQRLNDYFPALTTEDNVRLEAQSPLDLPAPYPPEYYGAALQGWLQEEGLIALRDFLLDFLSFLPDVKIDAAGLNAALGLSVEPGPLEERPTAERGAEILKFLAPLFKI